MRGGGGPPPPPPAALTRGPGRRAEVDRDVEEYRALRRNLEGLVKHGQTELELLTELGADVYASAHVPDATRVYVNAGLGFHVHCSIPEALELCDLRIELLEGRVGDWTDRIAKIKAYIKLVLEGVRELRNL